MDLRTTSEAIAAFADNIERVICGKRQAVEVAAVAFFSGQHLLLDDVPGVGKTMLARAIARSIDGSFGRIQGTSDLLPTDITGTTVYNQADSSFRFVAGPVFANVVLVDEINRATPKTQSALLQVMDEGAVAVDGDVHEVPQPFFVVATRNPIEHHGTFPLPEGELDRFGLSLRIGYPDAADERRVIAGQMVTHPIEELEPVIEPDVMIQHRAAVRTVHVDESVVGYVVDLARATREHPRLAIGASPRGSLALTRAAQAHALLKGRDFVLPDDVKTLADATLAHRILLAGHGAGGDASRAIIAEVLREVAPPVAGRR